jgi:nitronate monooxygenase
VTSISQISIIFPKELPAMSTLEEQLPWTSSSPLIVNAPMAGFAGGNLASAVTLAGMIGMIGGLFNMDDVRKELQIAIKAF